MYTIDELDTVVEMVGVPQSETGAPLPVVFADEHWLLLAYVVSEPDPDWDGIPKSVSRESEEMCVAIIKFRRPYVHMFGLPNDETLEGHPLAVRGLSCYGAFEVEHSSWIRHFERMNSVHLRHNYDWFMTGKKHFIFTFHDSTFECIAEGFDFDCSEARSDRHSILCPTC